MTATLAPCHKCGRPALVGEATGNRWQIGCFRADCDCVPIHYEAGNKRSRAAAVRAWNKRIAKQKAPANQGTNEK